MKTVSSTPGRWGSVCPTRVSHTVNRRATMSAPRRFLRRNSHPIVPCLLYSLRPRVLHSKHGFFGSFSYRFGQEERQGLCQNQNGHSELPLSGRQDFVRRVLAPFGGAVKKPRLLPISRKSHEMSEGLDSFLRILSFFIRESKVVDFSPRSLAAPFSPLTRQAVSSSAWVMCSRSDSSRVRNRSPR